MSIITKSSVDNLSNALRFGATRARKTSVSAVSGVVSFHILRSCFFVTREHATRHNDQIQRASATVLVITKTFVPAGSAATTSSAAGVREVSRGAGRLPTLTFGAPPRVIVKRDLGYGDSKLSIPMLVSVRPRIARAIVTRKDVLGLFPS